MSPPILFFIQGEEETLEDEKEKEHDGGRRRVGGAAVPLRAQAANEVADGQEQGVDGHHSYVELEKRRVSFRYNNVFDGGVPAPGSGCQKLKFEKKMCAKRRMNPLYAEVTVFF